MAVSEMKKSSGIKLSHHSASTCSSDAEDSCSLEIKENIMPLRHPQEIEVWYVIPAIRKELTVDLVKRGKSQRQVAKILGITEAAVSQYLKNKRANDLTLPPDVKSFLKKAAEKIHDEKTAYRQIQEVSKYVRESKALCKIHLSFEKDLSTCNVCYD
ncbi:helix-turn-helix domain-containing protein [Candidatus Woesearchaeota archaeon]|nr:helix-turn-helix domain-containing protein [Candidatus Woesearchaeota archaeon]